MLHQNYDMMLLSLIRRLYFALIRPSGAVLAVLAGTEAPYLARVATAVILLGVRGRDWRRVTRHLPRGAHLWARGLFRRSSGFARVLVRRSCCSAPPSS